jgi:hypothetical protein
MIRPVESVDFEAEDFIKMLYEKYPKQRELDMLTFNDPDRRHCVMRPDSFHRGTSSGQLMGRPDCSYFYVIRKFDTEAFGYKVFAGRYSTLHDDELRGRALWNLWGVYNGEEFSANEVDVLIELFLDVERFPKWAP